MNDTNRSHHRTDLAMGAQIFDADLITEAAIFGINLRFMKPFLAALAGGAGQRCGGCGVSPRPLTVLGRYGCAAAASWASNVGTAALVQRCNCTSSRSASDACSPVVGSSSTYRLRPRWLR